MVKTNVEVCHIFSEIRSLRQETVVVIIRSLF